MTGFRYFNIVPIWKYAQHALRAGAAGYIAKYEAPEKIISAIHQVLGGKVYVSNTKKAKAMHGVDAIADDDLNRSVGYARHI